MQRTRILLSEIQKLINPAEIKQFCSKRQRWTEDQVRLLRSTVLGEVVASAKQFQREGQIKLDEQHPLIRRQNIWTRVSDKVGRDFMSCHHKWRREYANESQPPELLRRCIDLIQTEKIEEDGLLKLRLQQHLQPVKFGRWTQLEDEALLQAVSIVGFGKWAELSDFYNSLSTSGDANIRGRNADQIASRARRLLKRDDQNWSDADVDKLLEAVENTYYKVAESKRSSQKMEFWKIIAQALNNGKTPYQCRQKYHQIYEQRLIADENMYLTRTGRRVRRQSFWTIQETQRLIQCVQKFGSDWQLIAEDEMFKSKGRTARLICARWFRIKDIVGSVAKSPIVRLQTLEKLTYDGSKN
ncbi:hypothetical protein MP228_009036 [Amoeboaphelidium protococcarum]|nr:hypothetical protein MP228_009036 [Amoeboaphelidium protococcarum]